MTPSLSRRIVRSCALVGAYCRFDSGAVNELRELLRRGGGLCLPRHDGAQRSLVRRNAGAIKLLEQMR